MTSDAGEMLARSVSFVLGRARTDMLRDATVRVGDWSLVVAAAQQHGVLPLVYRALDAECSQMLPAEVLRDIRLRHQLHVRRSLFLWGELVELLQAFEAAGILALPVKGPALAASLYGDITMRQFTDLDILVQPHALENAAAMLSRRGYRMTASTQQSMSAQRDAREGRILVDLQGALAEPHYRVPLDMRRLWARTDIITVGNARVRQPAHEDQIMLLTAHPAKHCWSRLGWIADVAACVRTHGMSIDWAEVLHDARRAGGERLLLIGLGLAEEVLDVPLPVEVRRRLHREHVANDLTRALRQRLFVSRGVRIPLNGTYGQIEAPLLYLRSRERWRDRAPVALEMLRRFSQVCSLKPNTQDLAALRLPPYASFLYYLVRPIRLARKYGPRLVAQLRASVPTS